MRIVGGKDYYDSGLAYGVDESVVFVRTGRRVFSYEPATGLGDIWWGSAPGIRFPDGSTARHAPPPRWGSPHYSPESGTSWWHEGTSYYADGVQVVLCGKYYGGLRIRSHKPAYINNAAEYTEIHRPSARSLKAWHSETFWDQNSAGRYLGKCGAAVSTGKNRIGRRAGSPEAKPFHKGPLPQATVDRLIQNRITVATRCSEDSENALRPGDKHNQNWPFWRVDDDTLKLFTFAKLMDPVTCFQEIEMWVSGVLPRNGAKMVEITDDKVKAAKHGYDQWSFRKMPESSK